MKYVYKGTELLGSVFDEVDTEAILSEYKKDETPLFISHKEYQNPIFEDGILREMTKKELYKQGKYELAYNEIIEDDKIKTVELDRYNHIVDNKIVFDKMTCLKDIEQNIRHKEITEKEKEFIFKDHIQPNRELEDQTSLLKVISLLQATKQTEFKSWKMYTKDNKEEYVTLTLSELMQMAMLMQLQTTKAMKIASTLRGNLEKMSDEQLKKYNVEVEWSKLNENKEN